MLRHYIEIDEEAVVYLIAITEIVDKSNDHSVLSWLHDPTALEVAHVTAAGTNAGTTAGEETFVVAFDFILEEIRFRCYRVGQCLTGCAIAQTNEADGISGF